jgi:hypothetical protein
MGLFEFVSNIGKKLFPAHAPKEDAAAKIKAEDRVRESRH